MAILNPLDLNQLFHTDKIKASGLGQIFSMRLDGSSSVYHESSVVASKKDSRYNASTIFTNSQMICFLNICPNQMTLRNEFLGGYKEIQENSNWELYCLCLPTLFNEMNRKLFM